MMGHNVRLPPEELTVFHYRVKLGPVWLHAVSLGTGDEVIARLRVADSVWARAMVELVASRPLMDWLGPFPAEGDSKFWLVEEEP